jgi:CRP-like cAMP-binding protein
MELTKRSVPARHPSGATGEVGEILAALPRFALFSALDPASRAELAEGMRLRTWSAGSLIFSRGDEGAHLLALRDGRIRISLSSARGREIVLRNLGPGDILGEMSLIDGQPRSADATAIQDTTCLVLPRQRFEVIAARRPDIGLALARHLCAMLRNTNFQMESIALHDLQTRLVRFLLYVLDQTPASGADPIRRITLGLNQVEISAILGATRPKVSQAFQSLLAAGVLQRDGDVLVCNVDQLSLMAEGDAP